jgi:hypothetical protein
VSVNETESRKRQREKGKRKEETYETMPGIFSRGKRPRTVHSGRRQRGLERVRGEIREG